jgi:HSP20 family protein
MTKSPVWNDIETLWHEMDKAFTGLLAPPPVAGFADQASATYPSIRLHEGPDALYVEAMVPGVDPDTLSLSVVRRTLTLAGETRPLHAESDAEPRVFHRKERSEGRFERRFTLPMEVDTEKVSAEYADGMLRVTLPKLGQDTPRQINIQAA